MTVKRIGLMAAFTAILIVADFALTAIPGLQIIMLLMFIGAKKFNWLELIVIIAAYSLIDNTLYGGVSLYTVSMGWAWLLVSILPYYLKKYDLKGHTLAKLSILTSFLFSIPFLLTSIVLYDINVVDYLIADIPFTIGTALSSYVTIDLLYDRLIKAWK